MRWLGLAVLPAMLAAAPWAHANGRFPRGERLLEDPADPQHLVLAATYGLLVTADRGHSWYHVCEGAFAELGSEADPVASFNASGSLIASLNSNLSYGSQDNCNFESTLGRGKTELVPDFTVDAASPDRAVAVVGAVDNGKITSYRLQESSDGGRTFRPFGAVLPESVQLVTTIDVAPSDPLRIYVSGLGAGNVGLLLTSSNRGESFDVTELPTSAQDTETPYIAAIAHDDPNVIYVRTDRWVYDADTGISMASDALLYSSDGGAHFSELMRARGKLLGFALSPDGEQLLLGYGDPVEGQGRLVENAALGIYKGPSGTANPTRVFGGSLSCLTWTSNGIYACTSQAELGFALARVDEASLVLGEYPSFEPLLDLFDVKGPLGCSACSSAASCRESWRATCLAWGRTDCEDGASAAPQACSDEAGAGGTPNPPEPMTSGGDARGGRDPRSVGGRDVIDGTPTEAGDESGCGCQLREDRSRAGALALLGLLGASWFRRRQRHLQTRSR